MKKLNLLLILTVFLSFLSCTDEDKPSKKELISGHKWILEAYTVDPALNWDGYGTMVTNIFAQLDPCTQDDIFNLSSNGTYTAEEGATKCDINDPQVFGTGTWTFNSDETVLVITYTGETDVDNYQIKELTSSKMVLVEVVTSDDYVTYTFTETYKKP
jgi:hypothetical protein